MTDHEPTYEALESALRQAESEMSPAESHGLICGMLCVDPAVSDDRWIGEVVSESPEGGTDPAGARELLARLRGASAAALAGEEVGLQLFLPADDAALMLRTEALIHWCNAFLYGLGVAGLRDDASLSPQAREVLEELTEVSQLDPEAEGEEDERAFFDVSEFVRVSVMLLYEDLRERDRVEHPTVH